MTPPHPDQWKRHEQAINRLMPELAPLLDRLRAQQPRQ
jgi:hypothetical protein